MNLIRPLGFYYPTQVLCVDDDPSLLGGLDLGLGPFFKIKTEKNPLNVLKHLKLTASSQDEPLMERIRDEDLDEEFDCPINLRISKIIDKASDKVRQNEFSVLIVDHSMPEMTGFELCEELANHPIKKIMLTGKKDHNLAAKAFNKGLIDYFIPKDQPNLMEHLVGIIGLLQQRYFEEKTSFVIKAARSLHKSFLGSAQFIHEFNAFLHQYKIVEFYLLDVVGSYLGLDAKGNPHWFLARTEGHMLELLDLAEGVVLQEALRKGLQDRTKLVYFLREEQRNLGLDQWSKLAHSVSSEHNGIYLAWVEGAIKGF